ncbi:MAG: alanine racemase [Calditrichota bacterium]
MAEVITAESHEPHRPTFARVDSSALAENFQAFRRHAPGAKIMAVVKADAYGHGLLKCARLFSDMGADYFGVGFVEEGITLRRAGITKPILVLGGIVGNQISHFLDHDLDMTASSVFKIEAINAEASGNGRRARVHLKIDTGMNRIGQNFRTASLLFAAAHRCTNVEVVGIYSHLATAEESAPQFTQTQIARFREVLAEAEAAGLQPGLRHLVNSAGAIRFPEAHFDMIRPGIGLYGLHAAPELQKEFPLQPALSLISEIVYLKRVRKGEGVSYNLTWRAPADVWVATVPVGYGDGYPRLLSGRAQVLIGGKRYPIIGTICMDQFMVCLGQDHCKIGDPVVMWGRQGDEEITLWDLCRPSGFIPYELPILLTGRVPRVFV